mmetsp:Transcript_47428/g.151912  ORF Transcript_47428/g.151912 Transcript_47428/m.151912 type:complete len:238 (+) Transcript_47428:600-1313(+)
MRQQARFNSWRAGRAAPAARAQAKRHLGGHVCVRGAGCSSRWPRGRVHQGQRGSQLGGQQFRQARRRPRRQPGPPVLDPLLHRKVRQGEQGASRERTPRQGGGGAGCHARRLFSCDGRGGASSAELSEGPAVGSGASDKHAARALHTRRGREGGSCRGLAHVVQHAGGGAQRRRHGDADRWDARQIGGRGRVPVDRSRCQIHARGGGGHRQLPFQSAGQGQGLGAGGDPSYSLFIYI